MKARRTKAYITYEGADITKDLEEYLLSVSYTDNEEEKADDLQISLEDKDGTWVSDWLEQTGAKGAEISALIVQVDENGGEVVLDCGVFKVDSVSENGPPTKVALKATSIPTDSKVSIEKKTKAWEKIKLSAIAGEIAGKNGLRIIFESNFDPFYVRKEQVQKSDIVFLQELCKKAGISLKVTAKMLVLFDASKYESKESVKTIKKGESDVVRWNFGTSYKDTAYAKCEVTYTDPNTKKTIKGSFESPTAAESTGKVLKINEKANNKKEADELAKKRLREKNKSETEASFELVGDLGLVSGVTVTVIGWGFYDGKYIVQNSGHSISRGGYKTNISIRKVLEGY